MNQRPRHVQRQQGVQQQQVGYPRVIGYVAGEEEVEGYAPGVGYVAGAPYEVPMPQGRPIVGRRHHVGPPHPAIRSAPWRPMLAPGSPPLGEGHVPMPLNPESFGGAWGSTGLTTVNTSNGLITFSARPQKPFKTSRLLITKGGTANGLSTSQLVGQNYVGTDLQQGEVGQIALEALGAPSSFDTWVSFKQAEPGVWIRVQAQLLSVAGFTSTTDYVQYNITAIGHYLH